MDIFKDVVAQLKEIAAQQNWSERDLSAVIFQAVLAISHVSTGWRSVVHNTRAVWTRLDLERPGFLDACLSHCGDHLPLAIRGSIPLEIESYADSPWHSKLQQHRQQIESVRISSFNPNGLKSLMKILNDFPVLSTLRSLSLFSSIHGVTQTISIRPDAFMSLTCLELYSVDLTMEFVHAGYLPCLQTMSVASSQVNFLTIFTVIILLLLSPNIRRVNLDFTRSPSLPEDFIRSVRGLFRQLCLTELKELDLLGVQGDITTFLTNKLETPALERISILHTCPECLASYLLLQHPHSRILRSFRDCECDLELIQAESPHMACHSLVLTPRLALNRGRMRCCPEFRAVLNPIPSHLCTGTYVNFLTKLGLDVTHRITFLTFSMHDLDILRHVQGWQLDWRELFLKFQRLDTLKLIDVQVSSSLLRTLTIALASWSFLLDKLRTIEVNFVEEDGNEVAGAAAYTAGWNTVVKQCSAVECLDLKGVPLTVMADDGWQDEYASIQAILVVRRQSNGDARW